WELLLRQAGWEWKRRIGVVDCWQRPGKEGRGHSATTNARGSDRFCVFSTSTKFKVTQPGGRSKAGYDRFGFYAAEYHGGDQSAAARELYARGYGARRNGHASSANGAAAGKSDDGTKGPHQPTEAPWGEPARVIGLPSAPTLNLALFSPEIANVALDAAERLQAPPDYIA